MLPFSVLNAKTQALRCKGPAGKGPNYHGSAEVVPPRGKFSRVT